MNFLAPNYYQVSLLFIGGANGSVSVSIISFVLIPDGWGMLFPCVNHIMFWLQENVVYFNIDTNCKNEVNLDVWKEMSLWLF